MRQITSKVLLELLHSEVFLALFECPCEGFPCINEGYFVHCESPKG